jgi:hypothetical protein
VPRGNDKQALWSRTTKSEEDSEDTFTIFSLASSSLAHSSSPPPFWISMPATSSASPPPRIEILSAPTGARRNAPIEAEALSRQSFGLWPQGSACR